MINSPENSESTIDTISHQIEVIQLETTMPKQERAKKTYENILQGTAELLLKVGFERISTNIIAEHVGISVPALYRYFPNKYAIINTLGARLMDKQNAVLVHWYITYFAPYPDAPLDLTHLDKIVNETLEVTRNQTAGLAILRTIKAMPNLQNIQVKSNQVVAQSLLNNLANQYQVQPSQALLAKCLLLFDVVGTSLELALEDEASSDIICEETVKLITYFLKGITSEMNIPIITSDSDKQNRPNQAIA